MILKQNDEILYKILILGEKIEDSKFSFETTDLNNFICKTLFMNDLEIGVVKVNVQKSEIFELYINKNDPYSLSIKNLIHTKYQILNINLNIFTEDPNKTRLFEIYPPKIQVLIEGQIIKLNAIRENYFNNIFKDDLEFYNKCIEVIDQTYQIIQNKVLSINRDKEILFYQQTYLFAKGFLECLFRVWNIFTTISYNEKKFSMKQLEGIAIEILKILKLILYMNPFLISLFFNPHLVNRFFFKETDKPRKPIFLCYYEFYLEITKVLKKFSYKLDYSYFVIQLLNVENLDDVNFFKISGKLKLNFRTLFLKYSQTSYKQV